MVEKSVLITVTFLDTEVPLRFPARLSLDVPPYQVHEGVLILTEWNGIGNDSQLIIPLHRIATITVRMQQ